MLTEGDGSSWDGCQCFSLSMMLRSTKVSWKLLTRSTNLENQKLGSPHGDHFGVCLDFGPQWTTFGLDMDFRHYYHHIPKCIVLCPFMYCFS